LLPDAKARFSFLQLNHDSIADFLNELPQSNIKELRLIHQETEKARSTHSNQRQEELIEWVCCLWKEILSQQRIRHYKILQSTYFAYDVGIISSYSSRTVGMQRH